MKKTIGDYLAELLGDYEYYNKNFPTGDKAWTTFENIKTIVNRGCGDCGSGYKDYKPLRQVLTYALTELEEEVKVAYKKGVTIGQEDANPNMRKIIDEARKEQIEKDGNIASHMEGEPWWKIENHIRNQTTNE